jgi:HEAT repeat protein
MTSRVSELLSQLRKISPLPDDSSLSEELLTTYEKIVNQLAQLRDPSAIQPLLESFGYGTGYGLYWTVVHFLEQFGHEQIDPLLISALQKGQPGTQMWAALMLGRSRNKAAIPQLAALLDSPKELVRASAVAALGAIDGMLARPYIERLRNDPSREVRAAAERVLKSLGKNAQ